MKKENKNIERLFQEKFKDFEVSPPDFVWENIKEKLHPEEKKRRVLPFWFKTAGIAASFVAIVSVVFYNMDNDFKNTNTNSNSNSVVNSETTKSNNKGNQNIDGTNTSNTSESDTDQNNSNSIFTNQAENNSKNNSLVNTNSTVKISGSSQANSKSNKGAAQYSNLKKSNTGFVSNHKKETNQNRFITNKTTFNTSNSAVVANGKNRNKSKQNKQKSNTEFNDFNWSNNNITNAEITDVTTLNKVNSTKKITSNSGITALNSVKNSASNSSLTDLNTNNKINTSINNESNSGLTDINDFNSSNSNTTTKNNNDVKGVLVENGLGNLDTNSTPIVAVEEMKIDTIALAAITIEENPLEKLLREKETIKVADEKEKWSKWAVNSFVSPVFFNSFSNGSPLSEEFASNEKTFNNSTSYGVGVAYNINKRLTVKTGISNLNLDFDTENIAFYSTYEDQSKIANTNIERNANSKYLAIKHEKDVSKNTVENQIIQNSQNSGNLNQRTQYIEVPLELSYALLNKKFGVAVRGGMSTLFLTENEISIQATDGNMQIGKASNLNDVHFSSNVGLGLSYNFMKNFQLNVEPTLKYQINTFNKNSEDFTPYVIGVNTGISYKF